MDDYEAPAMRFALDNEFEGGEFGADGEFYAYGQKKGKSQTKKRALYGVFDSSEEEGEVGFRGKGAKAKKDYSAPIGFISAGFKGEEGKKKGDDEGEEGEIVDEDDDEDSRPRFGAKGSKRSWEDPEDSDGDRVAQREADAELPSTFGAKKDPKVREGGWVAAKAAAATQKKEDKVDIESLNRLRTLDSGGKGLKMLQKMGYKGGGLGAQGQGIKAAIQAVKRADKEGLGTRPEPKQALGAAGEEREKEGKGKDAPQKAKRLHNWRVRVDEKPRRARRVYKTAEEIREEAESGEGTGAAPAAAAAKHVAIVDMRGREAKLVTGAQISSIDDEDSNDAYTLPLLHNLGVLIEGAEADVVRLHRAVVAERDALVAADHDAAALRRRVDDGAEQAARLEGVMALLAETHARAAARDPSLTLDALADVFERLRRDYRAEYVLYDVGALLGPILVPAMRSFLAHWDPFKDPVGPAGPMRGWRGLLRTDRGAGLRGGPDESSLLSHDCDAASYVELAQEVLLPKLMSGVTGWDPRTAAGPVVRLVEAWEPALPPGLFASFLATAIFPALKTAVDAWNPRLDPVPIHLWVHPWTPWLADQLEDLYPTIRYKIGVALQEWHPSDPSALALLSPWADVFKPLHMEALLVRCVLPKLALGLRHMPINPANQVLDGFRSCVAWVDTAPLNQLASMFEVEFFPRWLQVLFQWLTSHPDYEEVTRWYLNWKSLFPPALAAHDKVKPFFTRALDMMNNVVAGAQIIGSYVQPGTQENLTYLRVAEQRSGGPGPPQPAARLALEAGKAKVKLAPAPGDDTVSFKEALEQLAQDHGLVLLPKPGRQQAGKQLYSFGKIGVYMDNRLVYTLEGGAWKPIPLDRLVEKAKAAPP